MDFFLEQFAAGASEGRSEPGNEVLRFLQQGPRFLAPALTFQGEPAPRLPWKRAWTHAPPERPRAATKNARP